MRKADEWLKILNNVEIDADEVRNIIVQIQADAIDHTAQSCAGKLYINEIADKLKKELE